MKYKVLKIRSDFIKSHETYPTYTSKNPALNFTLIPIWVYTLAVGKRAGCALTTSTDWEL